MKTAPQVSLTGRTLVLALTLVLAAYLAPMVATFVALMMMAVILAASLVASIEVCARRGRMKREAAVTTVFVAMLVGVGVVAFLIYPTVIDQVRTLAANLPQYIDRLQGTLAWLHGWAAGMSTKFGGRGLPLPPLPDLKAIGEAASANASSNASVWVGSGLGMAGKAMSLWAVVPVG